jgi:hypothetical protein
MSRLWIFATMLAPSICCAQVTGTFSLDKTTFARGEPVFLYLTLKNEGEEPTEIETADPYSFCSGYQLQITRDGAPKRACFQGYGGSCPAGALTLAPRESRTERLLLNYKNTSRGALNDPVSAPGDYTIDALRELKYAPSGDSRLFAAPDHSQVHQVLTLRVDDALELPATTYAPYLHQLDSKDDQTRREAARTLATLAPPSLEPLLLSFATSKDYAIKQFASLALANLSTKDSLSALAQMLLHNDPGTYEQMSAAEYLGRTHDPAWFPLLLEVADQQGGVYLSYAAESGGDAAIPPLLARLQTTNSNTRSSAIYALGHTGSRAAVPILIRLLSPPLNEKNEKEDNPQNDAISANAALMQLTHLYAEQGSDGTLIPTWHNRWQHWWLTSGATATLYKPGECVEDTKLP